MDRRCFAIVLYLVMCGIGLIEGQGFSPAGQIPEQCFDCLCEASSECDLSIGCLNKGPGQYYCGPYQISYAYWKDADTPGRNPEDPLDFEKCLNSKPCAEAAIRIYMQKWAVDCNGDFKIDCQDYARIQTAGPYACNSTWVTNTDYWARFAACYYRKPA